MYGMTREDAITIEDESAIRLGLSNLDRAIDYLREWYSKGVNLYLTFNRERLYACDEYSNDEYYLLATGLTIAQTKYIEDVKNNEKFKNLEPSKLELLIKPIEESFQLDNEAKREELRQGKKKNTK